ARRPRTRWKERSDRLRGRSNRPSGATRDNGDLQQSRADLHGRLAPVPARKDPRQSPRKGGRDRKAREDRRSNGSGNDYGSTDLSAAEGTRSRLYRERQARRQARL